jgi:hypothetical protein
VESATAARRLSRFQLNPVVNRVRRRDIIRHAQIDPLDVGSADLRFVRIARDKPASRRLLWTAENTAPH